MIDLRLEYKRDTGNYPMIYDEEKDLYFYRSKGNWVLDESNSDMLEFVRDKSSGLFHIEDKAVYDPEYVKWLEERIIQLNNEKKDININLCGDTK